MAKHAMNNAGTFNVRGQVVDDENGKSRIVVDPKDVEAALLGKATTKGVSDEGVRDMRDELIDILNGVLKEQFDYVPLRAVIEAADSLIEKGVVLDGVREVKDDLRVVLVEERKVDGNSREMGFRYRVENFVIGFHQDMFNGCIDSVGITECSVGDGDKGAPIKGTPFYVGSQKDEQGGYYPNVFRLSLPSHWLDVEGAQEYAQEVLKYSAVLGKIQEFFETSKHRELYEKCHAPQTVDVLLSKAADGCEGMSKNVPDKDELGYSM